MMEEDLFSFYLRTQENISEADEGYYEKLKLAPIKTKTQLQRLCGNNEEYMSEVIRLLLRLRVALMLDGFQKKKRRKKAKGMFQNKKREQEQLEKLIEKVERKFKGVDTKNLRECVVQMNSYDPNILHKLLGLPNGVLKRRSNPGKTNVMFNGVICRIYEISRKATDISDNAIFVLIAKLLTSFGLKKKNKKKYVRYDIRGIVHRTYPREILIASKSPS